MLMWLPIALSARAYLQSLDELSGYEIAFMGRLNETPKSGKSLIEIDFDSEMDAQDKATPFPDVSLYLRIKCRNDSADPESAMRESYRAQCAILGNLKLLQTHLLINHQIATQIKAAGVGAIGAEQRPWYVTEMALVIAWRAK